MLNARYIKPGSEEYQNAVAAFDEQLGNDEDAVTDYVLYDVYFTSESAESENKEIEPEGNVNIFMTFKDNEHTKVQGDIVDTQVVHLKDSGEAEVIENGTVDVTDDSTIQAITFTNSNFSITGARLLLAKATEPTLEKNEWFGTLADARNKRLVLQYDNQSLRDLQNAQSTIEITWYNGQKEKISDITPANIQSNVNQFNGQTLHNEINNTLNNNPKLSEIVYVRLRWEIPSLSSTFFDFSNEGSTTLDDAIKFNIVERTFQPDEEWTNGTLKYVAIGPQHQYNTSGPLGMASNFHIVGFSSVHNTAHTNGNIVTNSLTYGSNFGTSNISGEISYIKSFSSGNNLSCGDGEDDILVVGKDMKVTVRDGRFALIDSNGTVRTVDKPNNIYQDTDRYSFLSIDTMKTQLESYNANFAAKADSGVTGLGGTEKNELTVNSDTGEAVWNVNASTLKSLKDNTLIINGLSNATGTLLIININPDEGMGSEETPGVQIPEIKYANMTESSGEVTTFSAGKVIWNIKSNYAGYVSLCGSKSSGTLITPCATVTLNTNWNGSAFANVVNVTAESHRTDFTGSLGFGVTKTIDGIDNVMGKSWQSGYEFQFVLTGTNANGKKAPMPTGSDVATNSKTIAVTYANRTPSFGKIDYGRNDIGETYTYTLVEKPGTIAGITYSQEKYEIQVKVFESGNGLSIENSYRKKTATGYTGWESGLPADGKFAFINKYEENKAHAVVKAQKMVNEQDPANDECFDFTLAKYDSESRQWQTVETVQNSGRNVTFSQLNYDTAGIYYYKITETGQKSGYTYDTAVYVVKVEVEQTNNKLNTKSISYYKYAANDTVDLDSLGSSISENKVIFNNRKEDNYVLPETGGSGTNRFTAMGLALMAGSLMCGYVMRRKRREGRKN